ncbi:MAG: lipopolysaccharide biosynthesis protein [Bacteroidota bacterium]
MGKLRRLAGETVLYGLGSILPRFLNFLLVTLHTRVFAPDEYGVITKLFAYVGVINVIFMFGMETAYFRFANKPGVDERRVFNLAQTVVLGISAFLSAIFIIMANPVADVLSITGHSNLVIWLVLIMFVDAAVAIPFARLRLQKKAAQFAVGKTINIFILVGLNVLFLMTSFIPAPTIDWVIVANLLANAFYLVFFFKTLLLWRPAYDSEISPSMFSYAYPIMLTGLAGMTNEMFSRVTLDAWLPKNFYPGQTNEHALGVFGACYKFAVLMNLAIQAFRYAAEPFFFANASEKNSPHLFARVNHYFVIVCCVLLLGVSINLDLIKYFLGQPEYWEGLHIVPILLLGYLFLGVYYNFSIWFKLTDKTYYGTIITVIGAIITIVANYFLIPVSGYTGSSLATLFCYFTMTAICYLLGQKYYRIPYSIVRATFYIAFTMMLVYVVKYADDTLKTEKQIISTAFHAAVLVSYLFIIYLLERRNFKLSAA